MDEDDRIRCNDCGTLLTKEKRSPYYGQCKDCSESEGRDD